MRGEEKTGREKRRGEGKGREGKREGQREGRREKVVRSEALSLTS